MAKPLLYQPKERWQIWTALTGAVLIHVAAVALAGTSSTNVAVTTGDQPDLIVEVEDTTDRSTPPPLEIIDIPLPTPPPPPDSLFADENVTPVIRRQSLNQIKPIAKPPGSSGPSTMAAAKVFALSAPRPAYPYEARRRGVTGSGVAVLRVDFGSGYVTDVTMAQTTGNTILDTATMEAFRRWRFKPGTVFTVRTPITFLLTGASY